MLKKLRLEEIYVGMKVEPEQLTEIYDIWIILIKSVQNPDETPTIRFIGKETNKESDKLYTEDNIIIPIYNDKNEITGDVYYEE